MTLVKPYQKSGSLAYLEYDPIFKHEKPYFIRFPLDDLPEAKQTNLKFDYYDVSIEDIRGRESQFKLDDVGFELAEFHTVLKYDDFNDFRENSKIYFKEIEEFLKKKLGAQFVEVYDCTIRRRTPDFPAAQFQEKHVQPIRAVHVDSSRAERVKQAILSLEKAGIDPTKGRTQMMGVWKPLNGPVRDWPLAVCDYHSCMPNEIVDVDQVYADSIGEGCNLYFSKDHRWYFASDQTPQEAWIIKQLDSDPKAADYCAHAAFPHIETKITAEMRESVEVRCVTWSAE